MTTANHFEACGVCHSAPCSCVPHVICRPWDGSHQPPAPKEVPPTIRSSPMPNTPEQTHIRARLEELRGIEQDQIRDGWSYAQRQPIRVERLELKRQWQAAAARGAVIDAARVLRKEIERQGVPSLASDAALCEALFHLDQVSAR